MSMEQIKKHCKTVSREVLGMSMDVECTMEPLAPGLNFLSDAFFVVVKNDSEENSLFVKVPPQCNDIKQKLYESFPEDAYLFQKEYFFYNSLVNLFKIVIDDEGEDVEELLNFLPKSLALQGKISFARALEEPLTFENLISSGHRMWADEFNGLDLAHTKICMNTYGKLHALGLALLDKKIVEDENLGKLLLFDFMKLFTGPLLGVIENGMKAVRDWMIKNDSKEKSIANIKYQISQQNFIKTVSNLFEEGKEHEMQVIVHCDARSNNILFKYAADNSTPLGAKLVDFQMMMVFNPFYDLVCFLSLSVSSDVLIPNYQILLDRYRTSLVSTLTRLNYSKTMPTVSYISENISRYAPMVLPQICATIDVITGEGNPNLDPASREKKFRSAVELCQFFNII